jgi:hypothetical protein
MASIKSFTFGAEGLVEKAPSRMLYGSIDPLRWAHLAST